MTFDLPYHYSRWGSRSVRLEAFRGPLYIPLGPPLDPDLGAKISELELPTGASLGHNLMSQDFSRIQRVEVVLRMHARGQQSEVDVRHALLSLMPLALWCEFGFEVRAWGPMGRQSPTEMVEDHQDVVDFVKSMVRVAHGREMEKKWAGKLTWRVDGEDVVWVAAPREP